MTDKNEERGFLRGLQSYGDRDFSIYMRRAFARSMGYTVDELSRPVVGIAYKEERTLLESELALLCSDATALP